MTDWSRLLPYREGRRKSFEELCYQLAVREFGDLGKFTSVDDSGGGDGVEFFLTRDDGSEWGWQAKFFYPDDRLRPSRRRHVIESLERALQRHPRLTRWFLCTPTSFTTGDRDSELRWWTSIEVQHPGVELVHWGDSELSRLLADVRNVGPRAYFFGDLPLEPEWFQSRLAAQLANLRDRYEPGLHVETDADIRLRFLARDGWWRESLRGTAAEAAKAMASMRADWTTATAIPGASSLSSIAAVLLSAAEAAVQVLDALAAAPEPELAGLRARLDQSMATLEGARQTYAWNSISALTPEMLSERPTRHGRPELDPVQRLMQPAAWAVPILQRLHQAGEALEDAHRPAMHVIGGAGTGKTHTAAHACQLALSEGRPALLLLGARFNRYRSLEAQILDQLGLGSSTWDEFAGALDAYAAASTPSPAFLVFDGLNEAEDVGFWRHSLPGLLQSLARYPRIRVVTTCRPSYVEAIWGESPGDCIEATGFRPESLPYVLELYFARYKLVVDASLAPLEQFQHPLFLKIFCESENPERAEPKEVFLGAQTLFTVLDRYLARTSRRVCELLDRRPSDTFLHEALGSFCEAIWSSERRSISLEETERLLDGPSSTGWQQSLTRVLLDEELLLLRDRVAQEGEQVRFTYDLLGGYLIARHLLRTKEGQDVAAFVAAQAVVERLAAPSHEARHPLGEDILRGIAAALPEVAGVHLYAITQNPILWNAGLHALFEMAPALVTASEVSLVAAAFAKPENRIPLLRLGWGTSLSPRHPLNLRLWDRLLRELSMRDRDLSWSVYVKDSLDRWEWLAAEAERACRAGSPRTAHSDERLGLAALALKWLLSSTVPALRDRATKALYWFGRRRPLGLARMTLDALSLDDPTVPERCVGAWFGVAMAFYGDSQAEDFRARVLPAMARSVYRLMFAPDARCASTHALMRDYASGIIELAMRNTPASLTVEELARATPPFPPPTGHGDVASWGHLGEVEHERPDRSAALHMDFLNYTVGHLVPERRSYDDEHPEYKRVLAQLRWRMRDLGFTLDAFGELDARISNLALPPPAFEPVAHVEPFALKYARVAFFELYGWRSDRGLLMHGIYGAEPQRSVDVDLDPSFPDPPHPILIVAESYLPERSTPLREWVELGPIPDFSPWLVVDEVLGEQGPWVLLDGVCEHMDPVSGHGILFVARAALASARNVPALARELAGVAPEHRGLPDPPRDLYTFAGEVPWRATYPPNEYDEVSLAHARGGSARTYRVLASVRHSAWESYHTETVASYGVALLAKQVAEDLGLWMRLPTWDLHESDGRRATLSVLYNSDGVRQSLTWLRGDLLDHWLGTHRKGLLWWVKGERRRSVQHPQFIQDPDAGPHYRSFSNVYRYLRGRPSGVKLRD